MPLYEYECDACSRRFEIIQRFSDGPPDACRVCGKGPVRRLASSPAIQFKGSGFYITDYAQKGKSGSEGGSSNAPKTETKDSKDTSAAASTGGDASKPAAAAAPTPSKSE